MKKKSITTEDLKKEANEINRELMVARADYADLLKMLSKIEQKISKLYMKLDNILNGERKESR